MSKTSCGRLLLLAALPLVVFAATGRAQSGEAGRAGAQSCRGTEKPEQAERAFRLISQPGPDLREALAAAGIVVQPSGARHGVLRVASLCAELRAGLRKNIHPADVPDEGLGRADWSFFELGDYLGVMAFPRHPTRTRYRRTGAARVYIFAREDGDDDGRGKHNDGGVKGRTDRDRDERDEATRLKFLATLPV